MPNQLRSVTALVMIVAALTGCSTMRGVFGGGNGDELAGDAPSSDATAFGPKSRTVVDEHPFDLSAEDLKTDDELGLAADDPHQDRSLQFGLLHAHTMISDGSGSPASAYEAAIDRGLDFFAVTPHNHGAAESFAKTRKDGLLIATNPALYNSEEPVMVTRRWTDADGNAQEETLTIASLRSAAAAAAGAGFIPLFGQEFSTISSGNHVNVFGVDDVLQIDNGDYGGLFDLLDALDKDSVFVQMNHPSVAKDLFNRSTSTGKKENDYGFDEFGKNFKQLVDRADRYFVVIEVLSGPALADKSFSSPFSYNRTHENDYYYYLVQGFHVSPSAGHDNHWLRWGDKTPARMGVYAEPSEAALIEAIRANRTYASEDDDLRVTFSCNGSFMGSVIERNAGGDVACQVNVTDPTDPDSLYEAELYYGDVAPQTVGGLQQWTAASGWTEISGREGNGAILFDVYEATGAPEFFYARVTQSDGERAWTAPVWINHPRNYEVDE